MLLLLFCVFILYHPKGYSVILLNDVETSDDPPQLSEIHVDLTRCPRVIIAKCVVLNLITRWQHTSPHGLLNEIESNDPILCLSPVRYTRDTYTTPTQSLICTT